MKDFQKIQRISEISINLELSMEKKGNILLCKAAYQMKDELNNLLLLKLQNTVLILLFSLLFRYQ